MTVAAKRGWTKPKWALLVGVLAVGSLAVFACYPGDITSVTEYDIVVTQFDSTHVFSKGTPTTFAVLDTVLEVKDTLNSNNNRDYDHAWDSLIVAEARKAMLGLGYTELANPDSSNVPDYVVVNSILLARTITVNVWYPGWGYPGWGYPGWGYPGYYPPYYSVSSYETGTVFIDMYDAKVNDTIRNPRYLPWTAILNGLAGTSASLTAQRLQNGIRQAFSFPQSPYLKID
jgi:hypothetical protein